MKRMLRLVLSCCLGLLVPAVIFPWLVQALAPAKKTTPTSSFKPIPSSSEEAGTNAPASTVKVKPAIR
ncbi:hypothetical protein HUW51_02970 [Adhaeribacter swui]|uniref:Uncharacterized protein n=1 Tax=Adhaeribacter swui TaxID=2086471 RepID=A0A7G7G3J8_9BACT|nr:hypothetical protein [Adhaeribacter swui]QNF31732.1 hypothetical protein HUW51_02970 [Adhaeribacter swui]